MGAQLLRNLIMQEEIDRLPEDPTRRFIALEQICRGRMNDSLRGDEDDFSNLLKVQYMSTISSAAAELGVEGLEYPTVYDNLAQQFENFVQATNMTTTRAMLRASRSNADSVRLAARTRGRIDLQIGKLRDAISDAHMPESKRKGLLKKLDELSAEINQPRANIAKTMMLLALVSAGIVSDGTQFLERFTREVNRFWIP